MEATRNLLALWTYSSEEWDQFVDIELKNKKEDNIYFGIGIVILGTLGLMLIRGTSIWVGLLFSFPLAILIPFLRMKFAYKYLKKGVQHPQVAIYTEYLLINGRKIELENSKRHVKSIQLLESKNGLELLEFNVQWITGKGPTNDEFRVPVLENQKEKAQKLIDFFS